MDFNVTVQVLCFRVNSVLIAVNVVFTHSFMLSTCIPQRHQLWFDLIVKMLKVFHENIQCYILYILSRCNLWFIFLPFRF